MKKIQILLILAAAGLLFFSGSSRVKETHVIKLYVDTGQITKQNVNQVSNFGQPANIPNRDFTIEVSVGDVVVWEGVSSNARETDKVLINAINHEGGVNVFDKNVLKDTPQNPGVVEGTVKVGQAGDEEKYKISFKVLNNGRQRNGTFHIDPKIRVR
jgi:hypothetical protein